MNNIRNEIQNALIGTVLVLGFFATIMLVVSQLNMSQNQQIIQTMTMEYSIISSTEDLINTYNDVVKNTGNIQFQTKYQQLREKLHNTITLLKNRIIAQESKFLLLGVENVVNKIILESDTGLQEVKLNNFQNFSTHYAEANKKSEFIQTNVGLLLQKELEFLSKTEENSKQIYWFSLIGSMIIFLIMIIIMVFFSFAFSKRITNPIERLTKYAEQVASGNMEVAISDDLTEQKNEVGTLSKSLALMIKNIKDMIVELNRSNNETIASKKELESSNQDLKNINKFMVDREVKMVELKKEIEELKKKIV